MDSMMGYFWTPTKLAFTGSPIGAMASSDHHEVSQTQVLHDSAGGVLYRVEFGELAIAREQPTASMYYPSLGQRAATKLGVSAIA